MFFHKFFNETLLIILLLIPSLSSSKLITIRTAGEDNNTVKYDLENKDRPGICIEVLRAIERVDPEIKFSGYNVLIPRARIESDLLNGKLDAYCALLELPKRKKKFNFIKTKIYTVRQKMAVRADDEINVINFKDIRKLEKEGIILVPYGGAHEEYLKNQKGLLIDTSGKDIETNFKMLLAKRGRFLYYSENAIMHYIRKEKLENQIKILPAVFYEENMYFVYSKTISPLALKKLSSALKKLENQGELLSIYSKYQK